jgi:hypothetical protein
MKITESQLRQNVRQLLNEEVYGTIATVYHGSRQPPREFLKVFEDESGKVGWKTGKGAGSGYGHGLYTVWMQTDHETFDGGYGNWIYKFKVNLYGFIIFDAAICEKVYGSIISPLEQLERLGKKKLINNLNEITKLELSEPPIKGSPSAWPAAKVSKYLAGAVNGIVFFGFNDGPVVIIYDPNIVTPMAYAELEYAKIDVWNKWNPDEIRHSRARSAQAGTYADPKRLQSLEKNIETTLLKLRDPENPKNLKNIRNFLSSINNDTTIRMKVAAHPKTPKNLLRMLANDKEAGVRYEIAQNKNTPVDILEMLFKLEPAFIGKVIAQNPNANANLLQTIAYNKNTSEKTKEDIAEHPNASKDLLQALAKDKSERVRLQVANNPNTSKDVLKMLYNDEDWYVRSAAESSLENIS